MSIEQLWALIENSFAVVLDGALVYPSVDESDLVIDTGETEYTFEQDQTFIESFDKYSIVIYSKQYDEQFEIQLLQIQPIEL